MALEVGADEAGSNTSRVWTLRWERLKPLFEDIARNGNRGGSSWGKNEVEDEDGDVTNAQESVIGMMLWWNIFYSKSDGKRAGWEVRRELSPQQSRERETNLERVEESRVEKSRVE